MNLEPRRENKASVSLQSDDDEFTKQQEEETQKTSALVLLYASLFNFKYVHLKEYLSYDDILVHLWINYNQHMMFHLLLKETDNERAEANSINMIMHLFYTLIF